MNAAQTIQQGFIQRLHAHRDAIDAEVAKQFRLVERDGCGIAFDGKFLRSEQAEPLHGAQDFFPLFEIENGRRAAAEENRARFKVAGHELELADEGVRVAIDQFPTGGLGKEGAVRAFLRAKGHMNVKALYEIRRFHGSEN